MFQQGRTLRTHCSVRDQTPETTQYESVDMKCPEQAYPERDRICGCQGLGERGMGKSLLKGNGHKASFWKQKCSKIVMTFVQLSECAKNH